MVSKIDLAVVAALVVGGALWIERGHRITVDAPAPFELAVARAVDSCSDNDRVPYSANCLAYLKGDSDTATGWQVAPIRLAAVPAHEPIRTDLGRAACPGNDNMPYPADCLRYLSGPLWRPE
jgi:hypothetical protein